MNYAIILSGGIGSRMRNDGFPKQYIEVDGKPILIYTLEKFNRNISVDKIIIVAASQWHQQILEWIDKYAITKFYGFAAAGETRQESILNGLNVCEKNIVNKIDNVIIHDAVRPLLSDALISNCFNSLEYSDGCMPVLPINDTVYQSFDGSKISNLLDRSTLFAGQSPEAFNLQKYLKINKAASKEELESTKGSSEIAYKNGLDVALIKGEEMNFKLTTPVDLNRFKAILRGEKNEGIPTACN